MTIAIPTFAEFFEACHGHIPFPWQVKLADDVLANGWPPVIDAPTGLGKTSVVDIAVYRLAAEADRFGPARLAHTRVVLVVDRRLIVDAAYEHVRAIERALVKPSDPALVGVSEALSRLGGSAPLVTERMRGGVTWGSLWADDPAQPAFIAATVDQFGSRLLFRGYGTSARMAPIEAGLLGTDTLVLLDEAHLSGACAETIAACAALQRRAPDDPTAGRPLSVVRMTATPAARASSVITAADHEHPGAAKRLTARKPAALVDVADATSPKRAAIDTGDALARLARHALAMPGTNTVLVVANTVDAARRAFDALDGDTVEASLVVGRCRPADRIEQLERWLPSSRPGRARSSDSPKRVIVATQTVEVGVDIDVDALVTEAAPIDSLVQRFGRIDRVGDVGETFSWVVRVGSRLIGAPPPYGGATDATWQALVEWAGGCDSATVRSGGTERPVAVDFGTLRMRERLDQLADGARMDMLAPAALPPVVTREVTRVWARTGPRPVPDEAVAAYLHGVDCGQPGVTLLWRSDLALDTDRDNAKRATLTVPPQRHEQVEVPLAAARRFLAGMPRIDSTDLEAEPDGSPEERTPAAAGLRAFVQRGEDWWLVEPRDVRPGDLVVVDASAGGHDAWGFTGADGAVADVADLGPGLAVLEGSPNAGPFTFRLDSASLESWVGRALEEDERDALAAARATDGDDRIGAVRTLLTLLADRLHACRLPRAAAATIAVVLDRIDQGAVMSLAGGDVPVHDDASDRSDRSLRLLLRSGDVAPLDASDESDASSETLIEAGAGRVPLDRHLASVGARARRYGEQLGLSVRLLAAVELAGRFHDLGKADARFQGMLTGGASWMAEAAGPDLAAMVAKSAQRTRRQREDARSAAGWPSGYRHEAISLALVEAAPDEIFENADRELVAHLAAAHHGHGRPLFPPVLDDRPVDVVVDVDGVLIETCSEGSHPGWSQPERFRRMCDRYGPWGLAWLEAIVRLADIGVSKEGG